MLALTISSMWPVSDVAKSSTAMTRARASLFVNKVRDIAVQCQPHLFLGISDPQKSGSISTRPTTRSFYASTRRRRSRRKDARDRAFGKPARRRGGPHGTVCRADRLAREHHVQKARGSLLVVGPRSPDPASQ